MGWIVASESDIERVWVEVDEAGNKTGRAQVEHIQGGIVRSAGGIIVDEPELAAVLPMPTPTSVPEPIPSPPCLHHVVLVAAATTLVLDVLIALIHSVL